jgi:hypothetical protein
MTITTHHIESLAAIGPSCLDSIAVRLSHLAEDPPEGYRDKPLRDIWRVYSAAIRRFQDHGDNTVELPGLSPADSASAAKIAAIEASDSEQAPFWTEAGEQVRAATVPQPRVP